MPDRAAVDPFIFAPDLMPLWTILDSTPEGRGSDWYPKLDYGNNGAAHG